MSAAHLCTLILQLFKFFPHSHFSAKRKGEDEENDNFIKTKRLDGKKCTDLIVLNLPWRVDEPALKTYFARYGDVVMAQVRHVTRGCSDVTSSTVCILHWPLAFSG